MENKNAQFAKQIRKTVAFVLIALTVGSFLMYFGHRSDAVNVAKSIKSGVLTADEVNVAFENVGGKLLTHSVEESEIVNPQQVLMQLDPIDINIAIDTLNANLASLKAQLAKTEKNLEVSIKKTDLNEKSQWRQIELLQAAVVSAQSSLDLAQIDYDRASKLIRNKAISQSEVDTATTNLTNAKSALLQAERQLNTATIGAEEASLSKLKKEGSAEGMQLTSIINERIENDNIVNEIDMLKAQIAETEANLHQQHVNLERLTLKAPQEGKVLKVLYQDGEMINANVPAILLETNRKYYDIFVDETQAPKFKPGSKVSGYVPALDKEVSGTVRFTTAAPSFADLRNTRERGQTDLTSYQVRIYTDPDPELLTGMTLEVKG